MNSRKANVVEAPGFKPNATEPIPGTMKAAVALEEGMFMELPPQDLLYPHTILVPT